MKIEKSYASKKYLLKIIMWTSAAVLLIVLVLSVAVFLNSQNILLEKEYESDRKVFNQVKINVDMMDTMASNLCKYLYLSGDVGAIMYAPEENIVDWVTRIHRVTGAATSANSYIHSITIYNSRLKQFYNGGQPTFFNDKQLIQMMNKEITIPRAKAISRKIENLINGKVEYINVFSYFMYDSTGDLNEVDGAIALNVKTDWFLENIKQINMIDKERGDNVFVLDNNNKFIEVVYKNDDMMDWIKKEYGKHKKNTNLDDFIGFFQSKYNGIDYLVSYSYINSMNTTIIKVQKLSEVYGSINKLKSSIIIITLVLLAMAFAIFILVSKRIYKPVGNLVQMISANKNQILSGNKNFDEIEYLNDFYKNSIEKLEVYHKEKYQNKDIMKHYWINRFLLESYTLDIKKIEQIFEDEKICLSPTDGFIVCVLNIDSYRTFMEEHSSKDRELLRFAVINITSEVIGRRYKNEGLDMKEDHIAIIISIPQSEESYEENIKALLNEAQGYIMEYFKLSVSASISKKTMDIKELSLLYNKAIDNMAYRLILGHSCVVTQEYFLKNKNSANPSKLKELEVFLIERIRTGNFEETEEALKSIFIEISSMHYDNILVSLINLASLINNTLENLKTLTEKNTHFDFNSICQSIMEKETLEEIYNVIFQRLGDILKSEVDFTVQSKNSYIIDAVKELIHKDYQDSTLSMTKISSIINIPSRRLSKLFKEEMQITIADYINELRLMKAAELFTNTSLNVSEVISKIGIDNETYFYKIFKEKFGLTPKEYAFKRIVRMAQE